MGTFGGSSASVRSGALGPLPSVLPASAVRDRRTALTAYLRAHAEPPQPSRVRAFAPSAGHQPLRLAVQEHVRGSVAAWSARSTGAPSALTPRLVRDRTAHLEASMASLRARATALSATVTSLIQQRSGLLMSLHGTQQSATALATPPSRRATTAAVRALQAVQARTGPTPPT